MSARSIRVLVIARNLLGGIRTYIKYTYTKLDRRFLFTFLFPDDADAFPVEQDFPDRSVQVVRTRPDRAVARLVAATAGLLRSGRFDVIHAHGFTAGVVSAIANAPFRVPLLLTSHDILRDEQFPRPLRAVKAHVLTALLGQADVIQSVSHDAEENLVKYLPGLRRRTRLVVVHNGIDVDEYSGPATRDRAAWLSDLGLETSAECVFGFVGRPMPQKGFLELIDATNLLANRLGPGAFVTVVFGEGGYIREYRARVSELGLDSWFHFAGFHASIAQALKQLDALLVPSLWEACPMVPMEAFVAGCPVIASDCIGLREVVADTPALVVQAGDCESLAHGMEAFLRDRAAHAELASTFTPAGAVRFDATRTAERLIDTLAMLGSRTATPR